MVRACPRWPGHPDARAARRRRENHELAIIQRRRIPLTRNARGFMLRRVLELAFLVCVGAFAAAEAVGQTPPPAPDITGWNRVSDLSDGKRIIVSVGSGLPIHCIFRGTTDHSLYCERDNRLRAFEMHEIQRNEIAWVGTGAMVVLSTHEGTVYARPSPLSVAHLHWPFSKNGLPLAEPAASH
jgi:hypothetical protein